MDKEAIDWQTAMNTAKDYAGTAARIGEYGLGTAAVGAGAYYLYDKEKFKKGLYNLLTKMQKGLEIKKIDPKEEPGFFRFGPTVTPSGPGMMMSAGPVGVAVHPSGIGPAIKLKKDLVKKILGIVPFIEKKDIHRMTKAMPPDVFTGVDFNPLIPVPTPAIGAVLDTSNKKETVEALKHARKMLRDPNIEKKVDKRVYQKLKDIGGAILPTATLSKGASANMNKNAYMMGYMSKQASLDKNAFIDGASLLAILGLGLSAYGASKHIPGAYRAIKKKQKMEAAKNIGLLGLDALGVAGTVGTAAKTLGQGAAALGGALKAGTTAKGVMDTARAGSAAIQAREAFEAAKAGKALAQTAGAVVKPSTLQLIREAMLRQGAKLMEGSHYITDPIGKYLTGPVGRGLTNAYNYTKYAPMHYGAKMLPTQTARNLPAAAIRTSRSPGWQKAQTVSNWMAKHPYTGTAVEQAMSMAKNELKGMRTEAAPKKQAEA